MFDKELTRPAYPLRAALAGVLLFAIGLAMAGGTYQVNRQDQERLRGWLRADGTVVELLKRRTPDGDVLVPLVAFTTASGERVSVTLNGGGSESRYYTFAPVKVVYHPDHPQDARLDTTARRWTRNALAGGGAALLLALGGYVAWFASRWDGMAPPRT
jgi:hypothetical protein